MLYRKKVMDVQAFLWDGKVPSEKLLKDRSVLSDIRFDEKGKTIATLRTLEGPLTIESDNHYIVGPGPKGEYWPVIKDYFESIYEPSPQQ